MSRRDPSRHREISIVHLHRGELNYVICFREVENSNFFNGKWFYRPDFHWGTLQGGFKRSTEAGCSYDNILKLGLLFQNIMSCVSGVNIFSLTFKYLLDTNIF